MSICQASLRMCGGVRAARYYALHKRNGLQLLWLEDLSDAPQPPWIRQHFIDTARHLGQFNAHWPEQALPQWEWLNRDGFRTSFRNSRYDDVFKQFVTQQDHPFVREFAPAAVRHELMELWDASNMLLAQAEATSKGVCHRDCHPKNLFPMLDSGDDSYTVAIDWVNVGIDSLGLDIGHLIGSPMSWLELTPDEAEALVDPLFDAYVTGLKESGWSGNEERVRFTFLTRLACEALRTTNLTSRAAENDDWFKVLERFSGYPIEEICARWGKSLEFYFACKDEALELAKRFSD